MPTVTGQDLVGFRRPPASPWVAMDGAGSIQDRLCDAPRALPDPDRADAQIPEAGITWNYTTWLNIAFLILAALLVLRFRRTGGRQMLAMMGGAPTSDTRHGGPLSAA